MTHARRMNVIAVTTAATALLALTLTGCGSATKPGGSATTGGPESGELRKVTLQLNWYPEMEHGGLYAAKALGFYEEEGLDVEIRPAGKNSSIVPRLVASREVDFGVADADQILVGRMQGADLTALAAPFQHSPRCIMVHGDSGIDRLGDLKDVTLAMNQSLAFAAYLEKNVPLSDVTVVPYNGVQMFVSDPKYAMQAYSFSEPFVAEQAGADPKCLMVSEIGYDPYVGMLVTSQALVEEDPELVRKMTRASIRGWQAYFETPGPAHELIAAANESMTADVMAFGDEELKKLAMPDGAKPDEIGKMSKERWEQLLAQLDELDLVDASRIDLAKVVWTENAPAATR